MKAGDKIRFKNADECKKIKLKVRLSVSPGVSEYLGNKLLTFKGFSPFGNIQVEETLIVFAPEWIVDESTELKVGDRIRLKNEEECLKINKGDGIVQGMLHNFDGREVVVSEVHLPYFQVKAENPFFYNFLKKHDALDDFFAEILNPRQDRWEKKGFDWKNSGLMEFLSWSISYKGADFWVELYQLEKKERKLISIGYHFYDRDIDFTQLCSDSIKDKKTSFIVKGESCAYVGAIKNDQDFYTGMNFVRKIGGFPFKIYEIKLSDVDYWVEILQEFSTKYTERIEKLNTDIKSRERKKVRNYFSVRSF